MPKVLVLYVTRSGHARALAQDLAAGLGVEAQEIGDLVGRKGLFGYIRSGAQASMGAATPIRDPGADLASAAAVILVQPVWASSLCPPLRTWHSAHKAELAGKKLALLATNKGSEPEALKAKVEAELGPLAGFALLRESLPAAERAAALKAFRAQLGL